MDAALDALFAEPPAKFTKARDALAKTLDGEAAAAVRRLRKPSVVAYALNQIARRLPDDVAELVDIARALARAQRKALRGDAPGDLRTAITRQREALRALVRKATPLLGDLGIASSHLAEVTAALHTALVDEAAAAALEAGRLEVAPAPATEVLGDIEGLRAPSPKRVPRETAKARAAKERAAKELADLEKAAKAAMARARELAEKAKEAATEAKEAESAFQRAQRASGT